MSTPMAVSPSAESTRTGSRWRIGDVSLNPRAPMRSRPMRSTRARPRRPSRDAISPSPRPSVAPHAEFDRGQRTAEQLVHDPPHDRSGDLRPEPGLFDDRDYDVLRIVRRRVRREPREWLLAGDLRGSRLRRDRDLVERPAGKWVPTGSIGRHACERALEVRQIDLREARPGDDLRLDETKQSAPWARHTHADV